MGPPRRLVFTFVLFLASNAGLPSSEASVVPPAAPASTSTPLVSTTAQPEEIVQQQEPLQQQNLTSPSQGNGTSNPFEENRNAVLGWISQFLSSYGIGGDTSQTPPQPIDQSQCKPCGCGLTNKKIRIVGGQETQVNEYPWMALLTYRGIFYCGGSLINSKYVLTAAHCVHGFRASKIQVRLLEHDQKVDNETQVIERGVKYIVKHAGYSPSTIDNDIALLRLDEEVELDDEFMPVCYPPLKKSFAGETGIVTGWGVASVSKEATRQNAADRGGISPVLQELEVPIMSNDECRSSGYEKSQITDNMLCAGYKEGGKDSCQGDSGGPLHVVNNNYHHIVGVVSWGQGCARPNYPGVYCRVNRYLPWILKYTADACQCTQLTRADLGGSDEEEGAKVSQQDDSTTTPQPGEHTTVEGEGSRVGEVAL